MPDMIVSALEKGTLWLTEAPFQSDVEFASST